MAATAPGGASRQNECHRHSPPLVGKTNRPLNKEMQSMGYPEPTKSALEQTGQARQLLPSSLLAVAIAALVSACADMSSKSDQPKAIDAKAPLASSASSAAGGSQRQHGSGVGQQPVQRPARARRGRAQRILSMRNVCSSSAIKQRMTVKN